MSNSGSGQRANHFSIAQLEVLEHGCELWNLTLGGVTEISGVTGGAGLTLASSFLRYAQAKSFYSAWLSSPLRPFYPPDLADFGLRLDSLPVLFLDTPQEAALALASLLGSNGFDLLVLDLASWPESSNDISIAVLGKIAAAARRHRAVVLVLTSKDVSEPSIGSLISLRLQLEAQCEHPSSLRVRVLKDKRGAVGEGKCWRWDCLLFKERATALKAG